MIYPVEWCVQFCRKTYGFNFSLHMRSVFQTKMQKQEPSVLNVRMYLARRIPVTTPICISWMRIVFSFIDKHLIKLLATVVVNLFPTPTHKCQCNCFVLTVDI